MSPASKEMHQEAKFQVNSMEEFHHNWIDEDEISALRTVLEEEKHKIDRLAGDADK